MSKRNETWAETVVGIICEHSRPLSAYDILDQLRSEYPKLAPMTVYRALNALVKQGRVHRLESLNAYVTCTCEETNYSPIMSICGDCGTVEECDAPAVFSQLATAFGKTGFTAEHHVIEVHGQCADCRATELDK